MLINLLVDEFDAYFQRNPENNTILWFDPQKDWEGLLPYLRSRAPLLVYQGGQLQIRYELARRAAGKRNVVYLPMQQEKATYLRPFFYTARIFDKSIEAVLRDQGIPLPEASAVMRSIRPLLPALAVASSGKGRAFWEGIVSLETALARLIPNFEDLLLQLLASPTRTTAEMSTNKMTQPFLDLLERQFGVAPPGAGEEEVWADRFTATLCLVDLFVLAGRPEGFPFRDVLPDPVHWDRCCQFLAKWQRDEIYKETFVRRARAVDGQYQLGTWLKSLPSAPAGGALLNVEQAVWKGVQAELNGIADKAGAIAFCRERRDDFRRRSQGFWAREGSVPGWGTLDRMAAVVTGAEEALAELSQHGTTQALIQRYAATWWRVDSAYRRFRADLDRGLTQMDAALKWTRRIYRDFVEGINGRFGDLIVQEGYWPPAGEQLGAAGVWAPGPGRRGVLLVDALRYELGQALNERLRPGPQAADVVLAPAPSVTALGMASLLPGWPDLDVDYDNKWVITAANFPGNLAERSHRLAWLESRLGKAATYDLDNWLSTPLDQVPGEADWIVVTSAEIDAVGEGAGTVAWHAFDGLLDRLEQAVRRLLALNCTEIHLLSDHGFLLQDEIRDSDKVSVKVPGILKKGERYLVGRDLPPGDLPALPVPGSDDLVAWFPRGIGCFSTPGPYNYMHGGISLQELVTPHVTVKQSVTERPVGVELELLTGPEIRNAIFKVRLAPTGVDLWSRGRKVTIDIARDGERVSRVWKTAVERTPVERALQLEPDSGLAFGDTVAVRVWDAVTGELLAQQQATAFVDLDL